MKRLLCCVAKSYSGWVISTSSFTQFHSSACCSPQGDEEEIRYHLLRHGPVSIAFQVVPAFRNYTSGVFQSDTCKQGPKDVNHAVLVVGYGEEEEGGPFWIIKNSWGKQWGEEGYFRMHRGSNMCGIAVCASYPILG